MALCSYNDVEAIVQLDFSSTLQTSITNNIIPFADQVIKTYLGYSIEASDHTEVLFGDNIKEISLKHMPVNSITSITEDGNVLSEGNESEFVFHSNGRVERVKGRWSGAKPKNITVVYNAGYSTIPDDIKFTSARVSANQSKSCNWILRYKCRQWCPKKPCSRVYSTSISCRIQSIQREILQGRKQSGSLVCSATRRN